METTFYGLGFPGHPCLIQACHKRLGHRSFLQHVGSAGEVGAQLCGIAIQSSMLHVPQPILKNKWLHA